MSVFAIVAWLARLSIVSTPSALGALMPSASVGAQATLGATISRAELSHLRHEAAKGDAGAMYKLGQAYFVGDGVAQDFEKAGLWYRKAAAKGSAAAMDGIAMLYDLGRGVRRDHANAIEWYRKAAATGNARAINNLGVRYTYGHGVPKDYQKAMHLYQKAAALGNTDAMVNIGFLYAPPPMVPLTPRTDG